MARLASLLALGCLIVLAVDLAAARPASDGDRRGGEVDLRPPPGMRSISYGYPFEGRLRRAMRVKHSEYIRYVDEYAPKGHFFGTWELVQLLERAARRVAFRVPGARLSIGELSAEEGGEIPGHRSHQNGRDVDISFYMTTADGTPYEPAAFARFDWRGRGTGPNEGLRFDDARNWELVAKLVADGEARVQHIFVADSIQRRLLRYGKRTGAPEVLLERAQAVMMQPTHGHDHRNHFHVRIYCAPADRPSCRDRTPYWPWYPGKPPGGLYAKVRRVF